MTHTFTLTVTPLNLAIGWLVLVALFIAYCCWESQEIREGVLAMAAVAMAFVAFVATLGSLFYVIITFFPHLPWK